MMFWGPEMVFGLHVGAERKIDFVQFGIFTMVLMPDTPG